jgi:hypothetical protein
MNKRKLRKKREQEDKLEETKTENQYPFPPTLNQHGNQSAENEWRYKFTSVNQEVEDAVIKRFKSNLENDTFSMPNLYNFRRSENSENDLKYEIDPDSPPRLKSYNPKYNKAVQKAEDERNEFYASIEDMKRDSDTEARPNHEPKKRGPIPYAGIDSYRFVALDLGKVSNSFTGEVYPIEDEKLPY